MRVSRRKPDPDDNPIVRRAGIEIKPPARPSPRDLAGETRDEIYWRLLIVCISFLYPRLLDLSFKRPVIKIEGRMTDVSGEYPDSRAAGSARVFFVFLLFFFFVFSVRANSVMTKFSELQLFVGQ